MEKGFIKKLNKIKKNNRMIFPGDVNMKIKSILLTIAIMVLFVSCVKQKMSETEKSYFLNVSELKKLNISVPDDYKKYEKFEKTFYFDFTYELEYEYEPAGDNSDVAFISQTIEFENKKSDVLINNLISDSLSAGIYKAHGIKMKDVSNLYKYGDNSKLFQLVNKNNTAVGYTFMAVLNKTIFKFNIIGITIDDPQTWKVLLDEKLKKINDIKKNIFF